MEKKTVLVVCNGNIHRSVIAEICLNQELEVENSGMDIRCISRGIEMRSEKRNMMNFPEEWALTKPVLEKLGITVSPNRKAQQIDLSSVEKASVILAMDRRVLRILWEKFPSHTFKMRLFSELVGKCEDIVDCKGKLEPEAHQQANFRIKEIAVNGISFLRKLVDLFSSESEEVS